MTDPNVQAFVATYLDDARIAAGQLGMPVSVILAQWGNETAWGTSQVFRDQNNFAGEGWNGSTYNTYQDKDAGLVGYIQGWNGSNYASTLQKIHLAGGINADPIYAAQQVEASPWAGGHYGGNGLENIIQQEGLAQYDAAGDLAPSPAMQKAIGQSADQGAASGDLGAVLVGQNSGLSSALGVTQIDPKTGKVIGGCPEGNLVTLPSALPNITKCEGRALLGAASLVAGVILIGVGLGVLALGTRPGQAITQAAVKAA